MVNFLGNNYTVSDILSDFFYKFVFCGTYNVLWLVRYTSQVHHVVPRSVFTLVCYGPPPFFQVGQVCCCNQNRHLGAYRPTVVGITLIVEVGWGWLLLVGASCIIVVGGSPRPHWTVLRWMFFNVWMSLYVLFALCLPGGINLYFNYMVFIFIFECRGGLVVHEMVSRIESTVFEVCIQVIECTHNLLVTSFFHWGS